MDAFQSWLRQLDEELKLNGELMLDSKSQCFLMFDETMLVEIEYKKDENVFTFKGNLGTKNDIKTQKIYPQLLEANFCWEKTNGATFGLQQYSEKVLLTQSFSVDSCDYFFFNKALEFFVNTFEYWLKNLSTLTSKTKIPKEIPTGIRA
jgi:hypothetical protein